MSQSKALVINKRDQVNGLYAYCGKCERLIDNRVCKPVDKKISSCPYKDRHMFKAIITVPDTNGKKRKTKTFKTRDLKKAIELKIEFERSLESTGYQNVDKHLLPVEAKPDLLIECMAIYIAYLNNVGVATHKVKVRSKKHLNEVEYYFGKFCKCLVKNNIDHTFFKVGQINDNVVSLLHSYLLDELNYANKTYNKVIGQMRQFLNWLITEKGYEIKNPFVGVQRRKVVHNKNILTQSEFQSLLEVTTAENGYQYFDSGVRKNRYKPWMKNAFRLALETGLRREEFMTLKFSDILNDEQGKPQFLEVENFKVNRAAGNDAKTALKKLVPITDGLMSLLIDLGFENYKGCEKFLIGDNEKSSRGTLIDFVSKAFGHFWKLTGIDKTLHLKHLRKTYLTALVKQFGDKAPLISNHSGINVLKKHYVNDKELIAASQSFSVFARKV